MDPVLEIGTMGGLFDTFRRHFVVLTKFLVFEVESRSFGRRWAILRVFPGRVPGVPDRARRVGNTRPRPPSPGTRVQPS